MEYCQPLLLEERHSYVAYKTPLVSSESGNVFALHPTKHFSKVLGKRTATATTTTTTTITTTTTTVNEIALFKAGILLGSLLVIVSSRLVEIIKQHQQQRNQQQLLGVECKVVKQAKQTKTFVRPVEPAINFVICVLKFTLTQFYVRYAYCCLLRSLI
uniref:Uncharacterized protein n=1 Tax=Glossina austeni TaxID=7395 RepID=A0A1A9UEB0_GLOAU